MNIQIEEEGFGQVELYFDMPHDLKKFLIESAIPVGMRGQQFTALMQEFRGDGFSAWHNLYWMKAPVVLTACGNEPVLELRMAIRNTIHGTWDKVETSTLPECYFQLSYAPYILTRAVFEVPTEYQTFDIHFELKFLEEIGLDYHLMSQFIDDVQHNHPTELAPVPFRCTPRMKDCMYAILRNSYTPDGKRHLLRSSVLDILVEALEEVSKTKNPFPNLKPASKEKLEEVKRLIAEDAPLYRGNGKLCRTTGLNEFILNVGFKQMFNMTPYEYFQEVRFEKGKELLRQGLSVSAVAHVLEYVAPSPFIYEFRQRFGYTPKEFQLRGL